MNMFGGYENFRNAWDYANEEAEEKGRTMTTTVNKFRHYLEKRGDFLSKAELSLLDTFDLSNVFAFSDDGSAIVADEYTDIYTSVVEGYAKNPLDEFFFAFIPCFSEGVIKLAEKTYIHYLVTDCNPEDKTCSLTINKYAYNKDNILPVPITIGCTLKMYEEKAGFCNTNISCDSFRCESDFLNPEDLTSFMLARGNETDARNLKMLQTFFSDRYGEDGYLDPDFANGTVRNVVNFFCSCIIFVNSMLSKNKPSRPVRNTPGSSAPKPYKTELEAEQRKLVTRNVGMFSITSRKYPKVINSETVRTYRVASWKVKGHPRRLKSGKIIWVRESVHNRQSLNGKGNAARVVINVKGERKED